MFTGIITDIGKIINISNTEHRLIKIGCSYDENEIDILIATDCISEGQNLQDCDYLINYDIHWNPVRLMQRIGRVDRRLDPEVEKHLIADHPEVSSDRGKIAFWNFLPPRCRKALLQIVDFFSDL